MSAPSTILGRTERLLLRPPLHRDLDSIAELWTDPRVTQHIGGPREREAIMEFFREYAEDPGTYAREEGDRWWSIVERSSGELVGLCSLLKKEVEGEIETDLGYFLLPAYWGRGYATEAAARVVGHAFSILQLDSLVAIIHPENAASIAVALKLGMQLEREELRSDGVLRLIYRLRRPAGEHAR